MPRAKLAFISARWILTGLLKQKQPVDTSQSGQRERCQKTGNPASAASPRTKFLIEIRVH
jgi:hypothetical protein